MRISDYLRDKWVSIWIVALAAACAFGFLLVMGVELPVAVAALLLFLSGVLACGVWDCLRRKRYYDEAWRALEALEEKSYLSEFLAQPGFYDGILLREILQREEKYLNDIIAAQRREIQEYKDYVQIWSHEIKTPIAAERLVIENNRTPVTLSLEEEVAKIEAYVEQMLYYSKSGSLESDYLILPVNLKKLVAGVLTKNRKIMVESAVFPKLGGLDVEVLTDPKWLEFIFGQLITNSVKYRDNKRSSWIAFEAEEEPGDMLAVTVADNGIGIPPQDMPRVFHRGFTGENGRARQKSTGMGLFLCKRLCDQMGIRLELSSVQGEGTKFTFHLKKARSEAL